MHKIVIFNQSTYPDVTSVALEQIAHAVYRQVSEHYAPFWEASPPDSIFVVASLKDVPGDAAVVNVLDSPDVPDALGYHDVMPNGHPLARVFVSPILDNGGTVMVGANSLSQTISHEVLEMLGDPYCDWWADMPDGQTEDSMELCDRVEGDSYEIDGVAVSNFLGPRAFRSGDGPYDWMGKLAHPFALTDGGYAIRRVGGPSGKTSQIFGLHYPEWKKALKSKKARFRRRLKIEQ